MNETKICYKCNITKPLNNFNKQKQNKDGYKSICRDCCKIEYYENQEYNKEKSKLYYYNNREKRSQKMAVYYEQNKEEIKQQSNKYYHQNKNDPNFYQNREKNKINKNKKKYRQKQSIIRQQQKIQEMIDLEACSPLEKQCSDCKIVKIIWEFSRGKNTLLGRKTICKDCQSIHRKKYQIENKDILAKKQKIYNQEIHRKIANRLRARMRKAIKNYQANKKETTLKYLGCSISDFIIHLEKQFIPNMNWEEFLKGNIHIDHTLPFCQFDLSQEENLYKICNYINLRPLWAKDNLIKCSQDKKLSIH